MPLHQATALLHSQHLSKRCGREIWLKLDALQPSGSFKLRGLGHACEVHHARGAKRFLCSSGGNAGLAVAYAGRQLGVAVSVVVPESTTPRAIELLRAEGAAVIVHGASWQEANQYAMAKIGPSDAFLHPFDDPLLWTGHASLVDEVFDAGLSPDAIVVSVGGGGLLSGIVEGLQRRGETAIPVIAVETEGAASLHGSLQAGERIALPAITSIATSLGAKQVCQQALDWANRHPVRSVLVSDEQALAACESFLDDHRILVEPACGASLALAYAAHPVLDGCQRVLIEVCGGATATLAQLATWRAELG